MVGRTVSPEFVGRADELAQATTILDLGGGTARHLLMAGEAGVGKTRFVRELTQLAAARGFRVLSGSCVALGGIGLPYAPFAAALRELGRTSDPAVRAAVGDHDAAALGHLAPGLVAAVSSPGAEPTGIQPPASDAQLFESLLAVFGRLALDAPVLLVIEDVHWADPATRGAITFLASNLGSERVVLALTFRSDELDRRHPLLPWLAELGRTGRFERIDLGRFDREDTGRLVAGILGAEPARDELERLHERADGNAFFIEELLMAGGAGIAVGALPATVRATLIARIAVAPESVQRILRVAAVAGRRVDHEVLARVAGLPEDELSDGLRLAVDRQLLVLDGDRDATGYAFRHALVQEAVYDDLLPGERRSLHRAYAESLETRSPGRGAAGAAHWAELAHHWAAAHDDVRAAQASLKAGDAAFDTFAFAAAQRQYECVLEFWDSVPEAETRLGLDRVDLLTRAARSAEIGGDFRRMTEFLREAIAIQDVRADPVRGALLRAQLGRSHWLADGTSAALTAFAEAMDLLPADHPTIARARVLAGMGQLLMLVDRFDEAIDLCEAAVEIAKAQGDRQVEAHALNSAGTSLAALGRCREGIAALEASLAIAHELGSADDIGRSYVNLTNALQLCSRDREALEYVRAGIEEIDRLGMALSYGLVIRENGSAIQYRVGDWAQAATLAAGAGRWARAGPTPSLYYSAYTIGLAVGRGEPDAAERLDRFAALLAGQTVEAQYHGHYTLARAEHELWQARPQVAIAAVDEGLGWLAPDGFPYFLGLIHAVGAWAAADAAERFRAARSEPEAAEACGRVERHVAAIRALLEARGPEPDGRILLVAALRAAEAEQSRAAGASDPELWREAIAAWTAADRPYDVAIARWHAAEAHLARGEAAAAKTHLVEAAAWAAGQGAEPLLATVTSLARRSRIDLGTAAQPGGRLAGDDDVARNLGAGAGPAPVPEADPTARFGLTRREREVLACLAEGWTNRQIAEHLFISENTAGVHVSNILGKLSAASRTEAAAIAHRLGMVGRAT